MFSAIRRADSRSAPDDKPRIGRPLATISKKRLQHFRAASGEHSSANIHLMVR